MELVSVLALSLFALLAIGRAAAHSDDDIQRTIRRLKFLELLGSAQHSHGDHPCRPDVYEPDTCRVPLPAAFHPRDISPGSSNSDAAEKLKQHHVAKRNALKCENWLWADGVIPFIFNIENEKIRARFEEALREFNDLNCVSFVPVPNDQAEDLLAATKRGAPGEAPPDADAVAARRRVLVISESAPVIGSRCRATVGATAKAPMMLLSTVCTKGQILHELMVSVFNIPWIHGLPDRILFGNKHVIGFAHEHTRPDRDRYIKLHCENIFPNVTRDFSKLKDDVVETFGEKYDFASIMHYRLDHFSRNGLNTIEPLVPVDPKIDIGNMQTFSASDIRRIKQLYDCI